MTPVAVPNTVQALRAEHIRPLAGSPITETFSTPPSSPFPPNSQSDTLGKQTHVIVTKTVSASDSDSLERRLPKTKPSLTHLEKSDLQSTGMTSNITLDFTSPSFDGAISPMNQKTPRPEYHQPTSSASSSKPTTSHTTDPASELLQAPRHRRLTHVQSPASPCFVHKLLDQGASLRNFLELNHAPSPGYNNLTHFSGSPNSDSGRGSSLHSEPLSDGPSDSQMIRVEGGPAVGVARILDPDTLGERQYDPTPPYGSAIDSDLSPSDDEDEGNSLTRQLAETAVGVRELSKQLGRARVRTNIQSVLIVTKARDNRLIKLTRQLAIYLMQKKSGDNERGLIVYVDNQLRKSKRFDAAGIARQHPEFFAPHPRRRSSGGSQGFPGFTFTDLSGKTNTKRTEEGQLRYWTSEMCTRNSHLFDFVVTLGGDGTVLFTSWLFQRIVPPVLPFALGSLGFLTNFDFNDYAGVMDSAIDNGIRVNLRMRFTCTVYRAVAPEEGKGSKAVKKAETGEILMKNLDKGGWEALEGGSGLPVPVSGSKKDKEIMCFTTRPVETFEVLNDLVVDRGPSPYVSLLELFGDEHHMTTVQADGLTVSTPTGSTAYSLSAGGSLVHPEIPALLITPICPHTLSFRPMLLPDTMELRICVPYNSRSTAWASFDGRGRVEIKQGDHLKVTASKFPFPTVCADQQSTDWFHAIARTLKWNERERQKSFVVVEEGPAKKSKKKAATGGSPSDAREPAEGQAVEDHEEDEADEEEEEDDDKFDIDDSAVDTQSTKESVESSDSSAPAPKPANDTIRPPSSDTGTPDRFASSRPQPPPLTQRHPIHDAARKVHHDGLRHHTPQTHRRLQPPPPVSTSGSQQSPAQQLEMQVRGEDGQRDFIRAPESLMQSNRSKIPKDRDVESDSMRTPRAEVEVKSGVRTASPNVSRFVSHHPHSHPHLSHPHRNHRRHTSVDGYPVRRAFAAWGRDESDSNASDSDA